MNHEKEMTQIIQFNRVTREDSLFLSFSCRQVGHTRNVPVSSCMGAEHLVPTVIFIHDLLYKSSRKSTSGTPRPLRIAQRQECPAELKAFLKSRSILIKVPSPNL